MWFLKDLRIWLHDKKTFSWLKKKLVKPKDMKWEKIFARSVSHIKSFNPEFTKKSRNKGRTNNSIEKLTKDIDNSHTKK